MLFRSTLRTPVAVVVGATTVLVATLVVGCATTSQTDARLEKAARKVPIPAGLTYQNVNKQGSGDGTREVDITYSNATMTCQQLKSVWVAALVNAHRATDPVTPIANQIFVNGLGANVLINLDGPIGCSSPYVAAVDN